MRVLLMRSMGSVRPSYPTRTPTRAPQRALSSAVPAPERAPARAGIRASKNAAGENAESWRTSRSSQGDRNIGRNILLGLPSRPLLPPQKRIFEPCGAPGAAHTAFCAFSFPSRSHGISAALSIAATSSPCGDTPCCSTAAGDDPVDTPDCSP